MGRTRARLLEGALRAVRVQGARRTTMGDIAAFAGVAKATLYNHFRTKDDVWSALIVAEIHALAAECTGRPLGAALEHAATRLSAHPAVRALAADDPAALAGLVTGSDAPGWQAARVAVRAALRAAGRGGDEVVLRWLSSHLTTPGGPAAISEGAAALVAGLPAEPAESPRSESTGDLPPPSHVPDTLADAPVSGSGGTRVVRGTAAT